MHYAVGIDLGTTHCANAFVNALGQTEMIRNGDDEILTPSFVSFQSDEVIVGKVARQQAIFFPDLVADCAKRDMGEQFYERTVGGKLVPPEVIQACILRQLRRDIVGRCGEDFSVVVTVPAYFDEPRRQATWDAAKMAGLDVLDIVNEPTAAALSFGERLGYLTPFGDVNDRLTVMVYDLGGGTFDVTVMEMKPGSLETLATDGDVRLGGTDWDQRICDELWRRMQAEHPQIAALDPAARFRLRNLAEDVKQTLSTRQETSVRFEHAGAMVQLVFTRALLEEMTRDLLDRTAFTMRQALRAAGRSWDQVARVLLVGGSSRMPMVRRMVEEVSGIEPDVNVDPGEAVARGAAIFAEHRLTARLDNEQRRAGLRISEVNSHSLGIEGIHQSNMRKENVILIPRNTPLPAETKRSFVTKVDNQPTVVIQVLEGESKVPAECAKLGRAVIRNLADCRLPAGTPIEVKYQYSSNGRFHVEASLTAGGEQARIELRRNRGLSSEHLTRWTRILTQDGGFDTFQLALQELLDQQQLDEDEELIEFEIDDADEPNRLELESAPALPYGAPQAAADELQRSAPQLTPIAPRIRTTPRRRTRHSILINLCGHLIASLLGLVMGYYILCWLRPDMNFLQLSLPGLP